MSHCWKYFETFVNAIVCLRCMCSTDKGASEEEGENSLYGKQMYKRGDKVGKNIRKIERRQGRVRKSGAKKKDKR